MKRMLLLTIPFVTVVTFLPSQLVQTQQSQADAFANSTAVKMERETLLQGNVEMCEDWY